MRYRKLKVNTQYKFQIVPRLLERVLCLSSRRNVPALIDSMIYSDKTNAMRILSQLMITNRYHI